MMRNAAANNSAAEEWNEFELQVKHKRSPSADSVIPITKNSVINIGIFVGHSSATVCVHHTDKEKKFARTSLHI